MPSLSSSSSSSNQRVSYRNGILLDASDFQQEQQYHRSRLALALSFLHGYGTVAGLRVEHSAAGPVDPATGEPDPMEQLIVHPGIALDRAGHLIEVRTRQCLRLNHWFRFQRTQAGAALQPHQNPAGERNFIGDLFLRFKECPQGLRPGFPEPAADATDAIVPSRTNDGFELVLIPRDCDPETDLPPVPESRFPAPPNDRSELLASVYAAYEATVERIGEEYPPGFTDPTAVFLSRIQIRLEDAPSTSLNRPAGAPVVVDDLDRPIVTTTDLLRNLLPV